MSRSGGFETTEFRRTFSIETDRLLRRRLAWFASIWGGLGILNIGTVIVFSVAADTEILTDLVFGRVGGWRQIFPAVGLVSWLSVYGFALFSVVARRAMSTTALVRLTLLMITFDGVSTLGMRIGDVPAAGLWYFWFAHLIACMV
ncbi:MAG: hypothetical protein AAGA55_09685, partial [Planctomycetota bacterium]